MKTKALSIALALLALLIATTAAVNVSAADSLGTAKAGDKVTVTGAAGHQYYYYTSSGESGYYWASYMKVAISERDGKAVDYINGAYKEYSAWCASYGEAVPSDGQVYLLSRGQTDASGEYYYIDENLSQNGVKGLKIPFSRALSCIKAAERLAIANGHAKYDSNGAVNLPAAYSFAVEIAIRCISDEVNADKLNVTSGYASTQGAAWLEQVGWSVADFYSAVKQICNGAAAVPYTYTQPVTEIEAHKPTVQNEYQGNYLILGKYELTESGIKAEVSKDSQALGVEAIVNGKELTVRIAKSKVPLGLFKWNVDLSYVNADTYTMLFGQPIDANGNVLDTPQNIMLYDNEPYIATTGVKGEYDSENEKATLTVKKTDTDGNAVSGMKFTLYSVSEGKATKGDEMITDENGIAEWKDRDLGYYLLAEGENEGYSPYKPESWSVSGATSAKYTTVNDITGWLIELAPGAECAVEAVNASAPRLVINKIDREANALADMRFTLYKETANAFTYLFDMTTDSAGHVENVLDGAGVYFIAETESGKWSPYKPETWNIAGAMWAEYTTVNDITGWLIGVEVGNTVYIDAVNDYPGRIALQKVNTAGEPLPGAEFTLEVSSDGGQIYTMLAVAESDADGRVCFEGLDRYKYYRVTETKAPAGYSLLGKAAYVGAVTEEEITVRVNNSLIPLLPPTGGYGVTVTVGLAILAAAAGLILIKTNRKEINK